jgi:hypothetical protein
MLKVDGALHAVSGHLEDAPLMTRNERLQHLFPPCLQSGKHPGLVLLHPPAIPDHVSSEYGGEATLDAVFGHVVASL